MLSFSALHDLRFRNLPLPSTVVLSMVREVRFLGMIFDERLTWVPHAKSLSHAYQSSLDLLRYLSHATWDSDMTTLLRFSRPFRSKLEYGAHVYCTASPCALPILDPFQSESLVWRLVRSSPIINLHV